MRTNDTGGWTITMHGARSDFKACESTPWLLGTSPRRSWKQCWSTTTTRRQCCTGPPCAGPDSPRKWHPPSSFSRATTPVTSPAPCSTWTGALQAPDLASSPSSKSRVWHQRRSCVQSFFWSHAPSLSSTAQPAARCVDSGSIVHCCTVPNTPVHHTTLHYDWVQRSAIDGYWNSSPEYTSRTCCFLFLIVNQRD